MNRFASSVGIVCVVLAVVIFSFASGLRRWHSGIFFALIGTVMLLNAARWCRESDN